MGGFLALANTVYHRPPGGGSLYVPKFVLLNGSNESFRTNLVGRTPLGGGTNERFTFSCMVRPDSIVAAAVYQIVRASTPEPFTIRIRERGATGHKLDVRVDGATAILNPHNDITPIIANTLYHFHVAADFRLGGTIAVVKVNGDAGTPSYTVPSTSGEFDFSQINFGFGGSSDTTPNNLLNGCLGQVYFKQGVYEPDSTLFASAGANPLATDWRELGGDLANPELLIMDWANVTGAGPTRQVVNSGTSGDLAGGGVDVYRPISGTINPCT